MPRNGSGTYTLPSGNPVTAGTLVEATWANTTLSDLGNEITNSLDRNGNGGMLAPFRLADGTLGAPGVAWLNEPSTGFYRAGSGEQWAVVSGQQIAQFTTSGVLIPTGKSLTVTDGLNNTPIGATTPSTGAFTTLSASSGLNSTAVGNTTPSTGAFTTLSATGNVTLGDAAGDTVTVNGTATFGQTISGSISGNAATVTNGVYTTGDQTIGGVKTFSSTISGSIDGNAGTVTNGVYTTGNQTIGGAKTFSSDINVAGAVFRTIAAGNGYLVYGNNGATSSGLYYDQTNSALQLYTVSTERFKLDSSGNMYFNSGYGSVAVAYGCRAWVNFNGTGTVAIRASANVTSITDNGTGDYTVNFTNAMPDANYSFALSLATSLGTGDVFTQQSATAPATGSLRVSSTRAGAGAIDAAFLSVAIFR